jgi:hypothetical protein
MEREALGQAVAELPVSAGWEIKHTPHPGQDMQEALSFIQRCDLYLILLGGDFAAPMGLEWERALAARRLPLAYHREGRHSPSAQNLLRKSNVSWRAFKSAAGFKSKLKQAIAQALLDHSERLGFHLEDVERLLIETAAEEKNGDPSPGRRQGAGQDGIILGHNT